MSQHRSQLLLGRERYEMLGRHREDPLRALRDAAALRRDMESEKGVYGGDPVAESRRLRELEQDRVLTQRAATRGGDN